MRIGNWQFDPAKHVLVQGGTERKLTPRASEVLGYLGERAGEVVTSDELLDRFWPDTPASTSAIYKIITELRSCLGDSARSQKHIKTVPKGGYSLVAEV